MVTIEGIRIIRAEKLSPEARAINKIPADYTGFVKVLTTRDSPAETKIETLTMSPADAFRAVMRK